jgi:hypothetical protein
VHARVALKLLAPAVLAVAMVLPLASAGASPASALKLVSEDKIVDGIGLHQSETQSSLASAVGSQTLVSAFEVGRIFDGGSSAIGWSTSTNGGKSWGKRGLLPNTIASGGPTTGSIFPLYRAADPAAAYDARHGKWLVESRGLGSTGSVLGIVVNASTNGTSWSAPVVAHQAGTGDTPAKGSIGCDNTPASSGYGTCYIAYPNTSSSPANLLQVIRSSDGGATWSAPSAASDASVGTAPLVAVQPPAPGASPGSTCGRVVVPFVNGTTINAFFSSDCGATYSARSVVTSTQAATHTVAQGLRSPQTPSVSMDKSGALYLTWWTRSFRITQTTLSAAANAGDTNVKVASVTGMVAGNTLTVDTGAAAETVTIATVGTAGATGTGVTVTPALASAHAAGAIVTVNGVPSTSTAAPNDIALSVMAGPTDAAPAPSFGAPSRIALEADAGALSNTVDHFIASIAADPNANGKLALFTYSYPVAACAYITGSPLDNSFGAQCAPQLLYSSSTNGGTSWSAPQTLASMQSLAVLPRSSNGPDLGAYTSSVVIPAGKLKGKALSVFASAEPVNGTHESMYVPINGLTIGGGS